MKGLLLRNIDSLIKVFWGSIKIVRVLLWNISCQIFTKAFRFSKLFRRLTQFGLFLVWLWPLIWVCSNELLGLLTCNFKSLHNLHLISQWHIWFKQLSIDKSLRFGLFNRRMSTYSNFTVGLRQAIDSSLWFWWILIDKVFDQIAQWVFLKPTLIVNSRDTINVFNWGNIRAHTLICYRVFESWVKEIVRWALDLLLNVFDIVKLLIDSFLLFPNISKHELLLL